MQRGVGTEGGPRGYRRSSRGDSAIQKVRYGKLMRNARVVCVVVCALLCLLGVSSSVVGQGDVASVSGRVLDPNGAIIIEATVTAKNVDTGVETVVQTNEDGIYHFSNLSPGSYEFTVSKRGFKVIVKPGVTLHLADTISLNYNMVDGVSANVGAASDIMGYGMTDGAGASGSVPAATALGTTQALVSVDDLQEFRVESSTYGAQYGRNPGAQIVFETKSGTNQWHGTASEYWRNDYFDAADYFTNLLSLKKPPVRQNDFGGTLGGPVKIPGLYNGKDKTLFHVSYEGLRLILPQPGAVFLVPDLCMRGDTASCGSGRAPAATALLPVVQAFPVPNGPNVLCDPAADPTCPSSGQSGAAQFAAAWSNPGSTNTTSARLDHIVSQKLRLFFRFSNSTSDAESKGFPDEIQFGAYVPPSEVLRTPYTLRTYTAGANSVLSSLLSNDFRLNYSSNVTSSTLDIEAFGGSKPAHYVHLAGFTGPTTSVR